MAIAIGWIAADTYNVHREMEKTERPKGERLGLWSQIEVVEVYIGHDWSHNYLVEVLAVALSSNAISRKSYRSALHQRKSLSRQRRRSVNRLPRRMCCHAIQFSTQMVQIWCWIAPKNGIISLNGMSQHGLILG